MKRLVMLALAGTMMLASTSCSVADPPAATVNGERITRRDLEQDIEAMTASDSFASVATPGSGGKAVNAEFVSAILGREVAYRVFHQLALSKSLGTPPAPASSDAAAAALQLRGGGQLVDALPTSMKARWMGAAADLDALQAALGDGFGNELGRALADADVTIDPRYGTWDGQRGMIDPPAVPLAGATPQPGS